MRAVSNVETILANLVFLDNARWVTFNLDVATWYTYKMGNASVLDRIIGVYLGCREDFGFRW